MDNELNEKQHALIKDVIGALHSDFTAIQRYAAFKLFKEAISTMHAEETEKVAAQQKETYEYLNQLQAITF